MIIEVIIINKIDEASQNFIIFFPDIWMLLTQNADYLITINR